MCLFDERLEVLALTAAEGCVGASQANSNLQAISPNSIRTVTPAWERPVPRSMLRRSTAAISTAVTAWVTPALKQQIFNGIIHPKNDH